jgi:hypothetical protein
LNLSRLAGLSRRPGTTVEVHALTPMMYAVFLNIDEQRIPVGDRQGTLRFPSRHAAQRALQLAGITEATFIHRSAYGEMIGVAGDAAATDFRETIRFPSGGID